MDRRKPLQLPGSAFLLGAVIVFTGSLVQSLTGFAFALLCLSLMIAVYPVKLVVPVVVCLNFALNGWLLWQNRKHLKFASFSLLSAATLGGMPLGIWTLKTLPETTLRLMAGILILSATLLLLTKWRLTKADSGPVNGIAGLCAGFMGGSTGMFGPPVVWLFNQIPMDKDTYRTNLFAFFAIFSGITLLIYAGQGMLQHEVWQQAGLFLPLVFAGLWAGQRLARKVPIEVIRKISIALLIAAGIKAVWSSI